MNKCGHLAGEGGVLLGLGVQPYSWVIPAVQRAAPHLLTALTVHLVFLCVRLVQGRLTVGVLLRLKLIELGCERV